MSASKLRGLLYAAARGLGDWQAIKRQHAAQRAQSRRRAAAEEGVEMIKYKDIDTLLLIIWTTLLCLGSGIIGWELGKAMLLAYEWMK